jgi:asparagine synthase (glutamine-hydrolysing)
MCGIFGFSGPPDPALLAAMAERLHHRGPDERGTWISPRLSLGCDRLSIVALADGQQPLTNEDGSLVLVHNGEIYNHRALRQELELRGHRFGGGSDGEVILHLYEEEGEAALGRLEGMFALALWDERCQRLLLARDPLGIKGLCYTEHEGRFAFASELKALLCLPRLPRRLDRQALGWLTALGSGSPWRTLLAGVLQLPAGHLLRWEPGLAPRLVAYWRPQIAADPCASEEALAGELERRLVAAVESHLMSEVALGAALSGGLDSSLVVAVMSQLLQTSFKTFTVGFPGERDERPFARRVADHCRTDHHEVILDGEDLLRRLPGLLWSSEEPDRGPLLAHDLLFARAAQDVRVVLIGEGSDELFGGYPRLKTALGPAAWLPAATGKAAYLLAQRGTTRAACLAPALAEGAAAAAASAQLAGVFVQRGRARGQALLAYEQGERLPASHLPRVDRMAMAHSLEARLPYLDRRVVELANRLPLSCKTRWRGEKHLLRRVARRFLPAEISERRKLGLANPLRTWVRAGLLDLARELLRPGAVADRGCFAPRYVERLLRRVERGRPRPFDLRHLNFLVLVEAWHRVFVDPAVPAPPPEDLLLSGGH